MFSKKLQRTFLSVTYFSVLSVLSSDVFKSKVSLTSSYTAAVRFHLKYMGSFKFCFFFFQFT